MSAISREKLIISQSNKLTESRYTLTVAEQRLVVTLLSLISPNDENFKNYEISISDFKSILNIKTNTIYESARETLVKLGGRVIKIPTEDGELITHWFSSARYNKKNSSITMRFDENLKPYLLQLKEQFTRYKLFIITQFQSSYTVRIYMFLKQYESIGYREIDLEKFKNMLEIDNEYKVFYDFKKRVLNQAKKEFEKKDEHGHVKSDITFDLETIRTGRKITRLRFNIRKQKYQEQLPFDVPEIEPITPAVQALIDHKISEKLARQFETEQGEAEILQCIAKYEDRVKAGKVEDTNGGYLLEMLKGRAGKKSKAEQDKEAQAKLKAKASQAKADQEALEKAFKKAQNELIAEFLDGLEDEQKTQLITDFEASEVFKKHIKNSPFISERYKNEGVGGVMISPFYKRFIKDSYLPEEYRDIEKWRGLSL